MRGVALALLAVAALGCGGPTPKPAAIDLMRAIAARESLRDRKPYLYLATVAAGNLQTLDGFLIGNRSLFPLVTLKPDGLHEGELEPLGVDGQHLLLAGIQGEPRGTIQTLDLDGGRARKAIGPAISEDPWTIRLWGPPHAFLAERKDAAGNVDIALRFGGTDTRAIHFPAAEAPARYFGWAGDEVLYTVGTAETSTLYRLNPAMGGRIAAATFPDALLGVLVVRDPNGQGGVSRGYALTTRQVLPERISLWSWEQGREPTLMREFTGRGAMGLLPAGWPITIPSDRWVVAIPVGNSEAEQPAGIYLFENGGLKVVHAGEVELAWLAEEQHLFWIERGKLYYRVLDEPEGTETEIAQRPLNTEWRIYPGPLVPHGVGGAPGQL